MKHPSQYFELAFQWQVVQRAIYMAVIVGSVLVMINHGMCIYSGKFGAICFFQTALTFLVPYVVSTVSSVMAMADATKKDQ